MLYFVGRTTSLTSLHCLLRFRATSQKSVKNLFFAYCDEPCGAGVAPVDEVGEEDEDEEDVAPTDWRSVFASAR